MVEAHDHERAWAEALAVEHGHQRELLAALRDELGAFARECASALTALDALVGLAGVTQLISDAQAQAQHASLAADVARRLRKDDRVQRVYEALGGGDVPHETVRQVDALLKEEPQRSDRELLGAVVSAAGVTAQIEAIIGPAPWAAAAALKPLARWASHLPDLRDGAKRREVLGSASSDLTQVLSSAAELGAGAGAALAGEAASVADGLRDTVQHVEAAARAIRDGELERVLAEMRRTLHEDLDRLRGVHESAHAAPEEWRAARRDEHAELSEEVRTKLERVERIRGALGRLVPYLQVAGRALTTVQRVHAVEGKLEPHLASAFDSARAGLTAAAGDVWDAAFGGEGAAPPAPARTQRPRPRARWLVAAALAVAAAILGVVLTRGSSKPAAPPAAKAAAPAKKAAPAVAPVAAKPVLSPVAATFSEAQRATTYRVQLVSGGAVTYSWKLAPPKDNPQCHTFAPVPGSPNEAVWHHADTDGCTHNGIQHDGTVYVTVTTKAWSCTESFFGTLTRTGSHDERCAKR